MSTNDELPPPPPPPKRASPLDYRNTDLVSRLLAATPPYLYNMPLVPNSYFFSEMLRSLVQAKNESARPQSNFQQRRSRKRSWTQSKSEYYHHKPEVPKPDKPEILSPTWTPKQVHDNKKIDYVTERISLNNNNSKPTEYETVEPNKTSPTSTLSRIEPNYLIDKPADIPPNTLPNMMFPLPPQDSTTTNMMLPPPPPMWYPPLYPSSYGIDPLHFFIDLRVSGHIYDRKNGKESASAPANLSTITEHPASDVVQIRDAQDDVCKDVFRQSRNASAFSVPTTSGRNLPMNLSNNRQKGDNEKETKILKFDVKSMGFDKGSNKTSTNYVMSNLTSIYKQIHELRKNGVANKTEEEEAKEVDERIKVEIVKGAPDETEEEKKAKDLRALIGLELVVDYMNHGKPGQHPQHNSECAVTQISEESSTDFESSGSPAVEVVALQDEISQDL